MIGLLITIPGDVDILRLIFSQDRDHDNVFVQPDKKFESEDVEVTETSEKW